MSKPKVPQKYIGTLSQSTADKRKAEIRKRIAGKNKDKYKIRILLFCMKIKQGNQYVILLIFYRVTSE